jgi:membrane protein implicated in regulation of membrane protease activity
MQRTPREAKIMVRYFYLWTPYVIAGTVVLLSLPWLGLIALMVVALAALPALAFAIVVVPYMLIQAISRRWHHRSETRPRTAPVLSSAARQPTFRNGYVS